MDNLYSSYQNHYDRMLNARPSLQLKDYDYAAYLKNRPWISTLDKNKKILDIGCGYGHQLYVFSKLGFSNLHGVELSRSLFEIAKDEVGAFAQLTHGDAFEFLSGVHNEYAAITLNDVLEHIQREKAIELLRLIYEALLPGGFLSVRVPNMSSLLASYSMYLDVTHVCGYTEYSLQQALDMAGFANHNIVREDHSWTFRNWSLRKPLSGLGLTSRVNNALHRLLYRLRSQTPLPSVYGYNLEMYTQKQG